MCISLSCAAEPSESRSLESDPRGGPGTREDVAQRHLQRASRRRSDDKGQCFPSLLVFFNFLFFFCIKYLYWLNHNTWFHKEFILCVCSDSFFRWCRSDDSSVLRLAFPAGQLAEVSVLQKPPESSAQVAQGKNKHLHKDIQLENSNIKRRAFWNLFYFFPNSVLSDWIFLLSDLMV